MLVIVSGIDKVGKTTLAKKLCDILGADYVKFGGAPKVDDVATWVDNNFWFHRGIYEFLKNVKHERIAVIDRFYPDEIVYSSTIRNCSFTDVLGLYSGLDVGFSSMAKLVYVEPVSMEKLRSMWGDESYITFDQVGRLLFAFEVFLSFTRLQYIRANMHTPVGDIAQWITS